jgi:hypothetical protein
MSAITHELLGVTASIGVTVTPAAGDWQQAGQGYEGGPYRLELDPVAQGKDTVLLRIRLARKDGQSFALQNLKVSFDLPIVDIHGTWNSMANPTSVQKLEWWVSATRSGFGSGMHAQPVAANRGVPLVLLLNRSGQSRWAIGALDQYNETRIAARMDEGKGAYAFEIERLPLPQASPFGPPAPPGPEHRLVLPATCYEETIYLSNKPEPWFEAVQVYRRVHDEVTGFARPAVPDAAWEPVFCTWYGIHKAVTPEWAERNARVAAGLGFHTFIMDDGWFTEQTQWGDYRYAGDWQPVSTKFPDFAAHVRRVQALGLRYLLWVAPFMVGAASQAAQDMAAHLLPREFLGFRSLCPRNPLAREHVKRTLLRLVDEYGVDGFKLDFIDAVDLAPCPLDHEHDHPTEGQAIHEALCDIYQALQERDPEVLVEFRQSYANLAMRDCATTYRAGDVPLDYDSNRWNITMTRVVSGGIPVHYDPAYWNPRESKENVARHMLNSVFSVPMLSLDFDRIADAHLKIIAAWMDFYHAHKALLSQGRFRPVMANGHLPVLHISRQGQTVLGLFSDALPPVDLPSETQELYILNGANDERVRLCLVGPQGEFEGEVFDILHQPRARLHVRALDDVTIDIPVGGFACLTRKRQVPSVVR